MFALFGDENYMTQLTPFALKDAPALIEAVFPAQKVSFEAQAERKAVAAQTLTGLGSYWKGRKPLILVRSVILGSLLPRTVDAEKDLEIFEMLMAFDIRSLAKRALIKSDIKPAEIAASIKLPNPWDYFSHNVKADDKFFSEVNALQFPIDTNRLGLSVRWRRDIEEAEKLDILSSYLNTLVGYETKACQCKRPEEVDQEWLYSHVWPRVNLHLESYGISVFSIQELIEQLGILRFGRIPKVSDTFSGGGSIPFESARLGCDTYASDLNPISCMLTWSALNIIGSGKDNSQQISQLLDDWSVKVEDEINSLKIDEDEDGNKAKAFLYCLETKCPETGWIVPLCPSWVISTKRKVIAVLIPDYKNKRFDIDIKTGASNVELKEAFNGTVQKGYLVYDLDGKTYRTAIKTLRGEYRDENNISQNKLRLWKKGDFRPAADDILQERLYAIQWYDHRTLNDSRPNTFFASVTEKDLEREEQIIRIIDQNFDVMQKSGLIPDMHIESGKENEGPIRTNGWTHWHHMFTPRVLLYLSIILKNQVNGLPQLLPLIVSKFIDNNSKSCRWATSQSGGDGGAKSTFDNQALKTIFNWANHSFRATPWKISAPRFETITSNCSVRNIDARSIDTISDIYITDPPYADAVHYHEITEFFIAWLRKNPPKPFDTWTWDSRRAMAIKGTGDDFRKGMVGAYSAMADHMPDNGMQCVMFTHQDTSVWSDMVGIFWAAGLQVVGAWYIATETTSELKKGGYVQGTVILMLRKRPVGENSGFKQRLLPAVRTEVKRQIETMMHLNYEVKDKMGEPVFNDSDLQMAGYAAALKVLTAYTHIGGEDVTAFALKPRTKGEVTVVDEIVQQAAEAANSLLVPEGLTTDTWQKLSGIQRFYLRMMDIETTGAAKLDNYQNFAKAFRVEDYSRVMGSMAANKAQLKRIPEFVSRDLTESNEIGSTWLGHLIIGLQQLLAEVDPQVVISQFQADLPDFMEIRVLLLDVLTFIENKAPEKATRDAAEVLGARLRNMRAIGN